MVFVRAQGADTGPPWQDALGAGISRILLFGSSLPSALLVVLAGVLVPGSYSNYQARLQCGFVPPVTNAWALPRKSWPEPKNLVHSRMKILSPSRAPSRAAVRRVRKPLRRPRSTGPSDAEL